MRWLVVGCLVVLFADGLEDDSDTVGLVQTKVETAADVQSRSLNTDDVAPAKDAKEEPQVSKPASDVEQGKESTSKFKGEPLMPRKLLSYGSRAAGSVDVSFPNDPQQLQYMAEVLTAGFRRFDIAADKTLLAGDMFLETTKQRFDGVQDLANRFVAGNLTGEKELGEVATALAACLKTVEIDWDNWIKVPVKYVEVIHAFYTTGPGKAVPMMDMLATQMWGVGWENVNRGFHEQSGSNEKLLLGEVLPALSGADRLRAFGAQIASQQGDLLQFYAPALKGDQDDHNPLMQTPMGQYVTAEQSKHMTGACHHIGDTSRFVVHWHQYITDRSSEVLSTMKLIEEQKEAVQAHSSSTAQQLAQHSGTESVRLGLGLLAAVTSALVL